MSRFYRIAMTPSDDVEGKHNNLILIAALDDDDRIDFQSPQPFLVSARCDDAPWYGGLIETHFTLGKLIQIAWANNGSAPNSLTDWSGIPIHLGTCLSMNETMDPRSPKTEYWVRNIKQL